MLDPGVVRTPIRQQVQAFDGELPVFHAEMLDERLFHGGWPTQRFFGAFSPPHFSGELVSSEGRVGHPAGPYPIAQHFALQNETLN